jgi:plastocyanin
MRPTRWGRAIGLSAALLVAVGGSAQAASLEGNEAGKPKPKSYRITQQNLVFNPDVLKINPGDTVVWTNKETDDTIHSVVQANGEEVNSPDIDPNTTFEVRFTEPFAWKFECRFHPDMFMDVEVAGKVSDDVETHAAPSPREEPKPAAGPVPGLPPLG